MYRMYLLGIFILSINTLIAQLTCEPIVLGTLVSYQENVEGSKSASYDFNSALRLSDNSSETVENYRICSPRFAMVDSECEGYDGTNIDVDYNSGQFNPCVGENMCYYHLTNIVEYINSPGSTWDLLPSFDPIIQVDPYWEDNASNSEPAILISLQDGNTPPMIQYSRSQNNEGYNPLSEDFYPIANGVFHYLYEKKAGAGNRIINEGIDFAFGNYFAKRYLMDTNNDIGGEVNKFGGLGDDKDYTPLETSVQGLINKYDDVLDYYIREFQDFDNASEQTQSELLFVGLWEIANIIGVEKIDQLITSSLSSLHLGSNPPNNQLKVAAFLYEKATSDGFDSDDRCVILDVFTQIYRNEFYDLIDASLIPSSADGDLYIRDNTDDVGVESSGPGFEYNSVDIWNRHEDNNDDGIHEEPEFYGNSTNHLKVRINGNFCEMATANGNSLNDYELEIYRSKISICEPNWPTWQSSFSNPNYLLGTFNFGTKVLTIPNGSINGSLKYFGDHAIITCPWIAPSSPNGPIKCSLTDISMSFMARLVDNSNAANAFDPITYETTGIPAAQYAYQNNNVAFKNTKVIYPHPIAQGPTATPTHGVVIPGGDPDDEIIFSVYPSIPTIHGSDEDLFDIGTPDFGEDYTDYGDVAIVLDDDTFADWIAGGAQGGGFTITQDQEIIITTPEGFFLGGIPASTGDDFRTAEIRYLAAPNFKPVAFDIHLTDQVSGAAKDLVHVEVWNESQNSVPRSAAQYDSQNGDIILSPNPVTDGLVNIILAQDLEMKSIAIYDLQGKLQMQQSVEGNSVQVNIDALIKGLYILRLTDTEGNIYTKKGMKL